MKNYSFFSTFVVVIAVLLLTSNVSAAKVSLNEMKVNGPGQQATAHLVLDEAPNGLSGYAINITYDPSVIKIIKVDFPAWALLKNVKGMGGDNELRLVATDPKSAIQSGAKNLELATITIEGQKTGSTYLHLSQDKFDDPKQHMKLTLVDGSFTVGDVPVPIFQPAATPVAQSVSNIADTPAPSVSSAVAQPTKKGLYAAPGSLLPVIGIILCIFICAGGYLRRR